MQTISIFGSEIPRYIDCPRCKAKDACVFDRVAYSTPCPKCKASKEFQKEEEKKNKNKLGSIEDAFKVNKPAAVWEGRGRQIFTNYKGDIIADEPSKPRPVGKKDWK